MKITKFMTLLMFGGMVFASCSEENEEPQPLTQPEVKTVTVDFEGDYWTKLIDDKQNGGQLIYSDKEYKWTDATTTLSSEIVKADWSAWGMGFGWDYGLAISNYINPDATSYEDQLSVEKSTGNFAVAYNDNSEMTFADGQNHHLVSIDLSPVEYAYKYMTKIAGEGFKFDVIFTFTKTNGEIAKKTFEFANGTTIQKGFKTFPLDIDANKITINFDGTDKNEYGLLTPKYVAIDNIVVEKK